MLSSASTLTLAWPDDDDDDEGKNMTDSSDIIQIDSN